MILPFIFILFSLFLQAEVQDHFKKLPKAKSSHHSMRNIDFIYMINLDQRPEKWALSSNQLAIYDIYPYRFSAVNGWELTLEDLNDVGLKFSPEMQGGYLGTCYHLDGHFEPSHEKIERYGQTYFSHCLSRGAIGIALSHLSILQDAYDSGYETIWVMEDDIEIIQDPRILPDLIDHLDDLVGKENWDILFTDRDMRKPDGSYVTAIGGSWRPDYMYQVSKCNYATKIDISPEFRKIKARFGAHSMILRRSGIKKLLDYFKAHQIFLPYDMEFYLPCYINFFTVAYDVVSNLRNAPSDNGGPNYLKGNP